MKKSDLLITVVIERKWINQMELKITVERFFMFFIFIFFFSNCANKKNDETKNCDKTKTADYGNINNNVKDSLLQNKLDYFYDSISVLTGTLKIESYLGLPGFGKAPATDAREDSYILVLDNSINVIQKSKNREKIGADITKFNNYKIHLASMGESSPQTGLFKSRIFFSELIL